MHQLHKVLPLKAPFSIQIEPTNVCNYQCGYCPPQQKYLMKSVNRPYGTMKYELFCKIIDDISLFGTKIKVIYLSGDGEPFLNKDLPKMVSYVKQKNVTEKIHIYTNGSLIDEGKAIDILDSNLDTITITVQRADKEEFKRVTKTFDDYEKILKNVKFLFNQKNLRSSSLHMHVWMTDTGIPEIEKQKFYQDFSPISDVISIRQLHNWTGQEDFQANAMMPDQLLDETMEKNRVVCHFPFRFLYINQNGIVRVCCVDWANNITVGDVSKEKLIDIWNGFKINKIRLMHLKGEKNKIEACANCDFTQGALEWDNLDLHKDELIQGIREG